MSQLYKRIKNKIIVNRVEGTTITRKEKSKMKVVTFKGVLLKLKMQLPLPLLQNADSFERHFRLRREV